jgi:hypothetical protein
MNVGTRRSVNGLSIEPPEGSEKPFSPARTGGFYAFLDDGKTTGNWALRVPHSKDLRADRRG